MGLIQKGSNEKPVGYRGEHIINAATLHHGNH